MSVHNILQLTHLFGCEPVYHHHHNRLPPPLLLLRHFGPFGGGGHGLPVAWVSRQVSIRGVDVSPMPDLQPGAPGSLYFSGPSLKTSQAKVVIPEARLLSYVGHLESKERLRIQPAQLFNFS